MIFILTIIFKNQKSNFNHSIFRSENQLNFYLNKRDEKQAKPRFLTRGIFHYSIFKC